MRKSLYQILLVLVFFSTAVYAAGVVEQHLDYTDHLQELNNPARGPISHTGFMLAPGEKLDLSRGYVYADFMRLLVDLGAFSSNAWKPDESNSNVNVSRGTSQPLDEVSLNNMRAVLDSIRRRGGSCVIRTSYDIDCRGGQDPELEVTLGHIKQLAELYSDYEDIISFIELGMFGSCGEMTAGGQEAHAQALQTFLDNSSDGIKIGVRSPGVVAVWMGLKDPYYTWYIYPDFRIASERFQNIANTRGNMMYRVGMYNDGYLGNDLDLGSYGDNDVNSLHRESSVAWLEKYGQVIPYGGDFVCNYNPDTRPALNTAEFLSYEGFRTHTSYLDGSMKGECYNFMDETTFRGIDSEYGGKVKGREYVRDHLGYRLVLRSSQLSDSAALGGKLNLKLKIQNVGFGNIIKESKATLILKPVTEQTATGTAAMNKTAASVVEIPLSLDPRKLLSKKLKMKGLEYPHSSWTGENFEDLYDPENPEFDGVSDVVEAANLPKDIALGEYGVYLRFSRYGDVKTDKNFHTIQFANDPAYYDKLTGSNYIGKFRLVEKLDVSDGLRAFNNVNDDVASVWYAHGYLQIKSAGLVQVFDMLGHKLLEHTAIKDNTFIPLPLNKGVYLVKTATQLKRIVVK